MIGFLAGIKQEYDMWQQAAENIVTLVNAWPESIEPPGPNVQAFAKREFGWRQFLGRWARGKALDDVERWCSIAVGLSIAGNALVFVGAMQQLVDETG